MVNLLRTKVVRITGFFNKSKKLIEKWEQDKANKENNLKLNHEYSRG